MALNIEIMENQSLRNKANFQKEEAYLRAERKLKKIKGFYWHAFWYVVVNCFLIFLTSRNSDNFWRFETFSTAIFWGIGLAGHALSVFGRNLFFSQSWEDRKIRDYMERDKKRWE